MEPERREFPRQRTFLGARANFNQKCSTLDCTVRNLSANGALLTIADSIALPERFELEVSTRQLVFSARMRWRSDDKVGVAFDLIQSSAEIVPLDLARRLKHCERDNLLLKARVRQLTEAG